MQRIDELTVELTDEESAASQRFDAMLDDGLSCVDAANLLVTLHPTLSEDFIRHLIH